MSTSHRIRVLGKDIQVRSSASPETVREVEDFVNGKLAEVSAAVKNCDSQTVAILALMNIAEAYLAQVRESAASRQAGRQRVSRLLEMIGSRLA